MKANAVTFLKTLNLSLQSGKTFSEALRVVEDVASTEKERSSHASLRADIQRGVPFSEAFGRHMSAPEDIIQFVSMAEKGGSFRRLLAKVLEYLEAKEHFYQESSDKIVLPLIYVTLSALIVLFVRFFAIPLHISESLQYDPKIQQLIENHLQIAQWMGNGLFVMLLISALYFLITLSALFSQSKFIQGWAKPLALVLPLSSKIIREFEKFMLLSLLGEMLQSGIPFRKAVQSASQSTNIVEFKEGFNRIEHSIVSGERQWWKSSFFDEVERRLLVGVGSMPQVGEVMVKLADHSRLKALASTGKFFRLMSVVSIMIMACAVFVEFFTVVLTQVLIQKGIISSVDGVGQAF